MKLPQHFYRLPLLFDSQRLQAEVAQFSEKEWQAHPSGFAGNSAIRLISAGGAENDDVTGEMLPTPHLRRCPYIQQVLSHIGVVWSRSRLMRLGPGAVVPEHCDIDYRWFHRVRVHIPIRTDPAVSFRCADETVHMAAGETWIFDNWLLHEVRNDSLVERVHLVADTSGTARFWELVAGSQSQGFERRTDSPPPPVAYEPGGDFPLFTERYNESIVMTPSEVEQLALDLLDDAVGRTAVQAGTWGARFAGLVHGFCHEWRSLWSCYGNTLEGWQHYAGLRDYVDAELEKMPATALYCSSNGVPAKRVLRERVLYHVLRLPAEAASRSEQEYGTRPSPRPARKAARFERPVFIVAAPRSGSTLLFETLSQARDVVTVGEEIHNLVEGLDALRPGAPGVESNRLTGQHATAQAREHITDGLRARLRDRQGQPPKDDAAVRLLEKTPKNALRIPFFDALFPDALFVLLWRDPAANISSIMEAWRSGGWVTYPQLEGWEGPWSLLLPPGWRSLRGAPLEEVAAYQWAATNQFMLDDLAGLPRGRWMSLSYEEFLQKPAAGVERICRFSGIEFDAALADYCSRPLPLSRYTQTPPLADKWRRDESAIQRVLPSVQPVLERLVNLSKAV